MYVGEVLFQMLCFFFKYCDTALFIWLMFSFDFWLVYFFFLMWLFLILNYYYSSLSHTRSSHPLTCMIVFIIYLFIWNVRKSKIFINSQNNNVHEVQNHPHLIFNVNLKIWKTWYRIPKFMKTLYFYPHIHDWLIAIHLIITQLTHW